MRTFLRRVLLRGVPAGLVVGGLVYGFGRLMVGSVAEPDRPYVEALAVRLALACGVLALVIMAAAEALRQVRGPRPKPGEPPKE
jgi:hypothetical protein